MYDQALYIVINHASFTYDHRKLRTGHPVRSGVLKQFTGCVVVGWVTTSEVQLLYVIFFLVFFFVSLFRMSSFLAELHPLRPLASPCCLFPQLVDIRSTAHSSTFLDFLIKSTCNWKERNGTGKSFSRFRP
jgi:hypothetical protein